MVGLTTHDVLFLSLLAGDKTTYSGGWGSWMTSCGEFCKGSGLAQGTYEITPKGIALLDNLANPSPYQEVEPAT